MRWLHVAIVLASGTLVFALQNLEIASMDFLWFSMRAPLAFLVAATYVAGMVTGSSFLALALRSVRSASMSRFQFLISALIVVLLAAIVVALVEGWDPLGWRHPTT
jgi:uncharacterized integral membrane protein